MAMPSMHAPAVRHAVRDVAALVGAAIGTIGVLLAMASVVGIWSS